MFGTVVPENSSYHNKPQPIQSLANNNGGPKRVDFDARMVAWDFGYIRIIPNTHFHPRTAMGHWLDLCRILSHSGPRILSHTLLSTRDCWVFRDTYTHTYIHIYTYIHIHAHMPWFLFLGFLENRVSKALYFSREPWKPLFRRIPEITT
jgi:hypothetical protein